jgi:NADPH:quinone reductase-like Zn-dependent oxidoreductase
MKAIQIASFGGIEVLTYEDVERPKPGPSQVLVRVEASGVGPWDVWIREGRSVLPQPLPLILGSDRAGVVEAVGPGVEAFAVGDAVFGVTNSRFIGAYAQFALAETAMIAHRPWQISVLEAASVPVIATTAWQMLVDHAEAKASQTVLVLGGAGNVGAFAVQMARHLGARVVATARGTQFEEVRTLGADSVADRVELALSQVAGRLDVVIDTLGGSALAEAMEAVRPGGVVISAVEEPDQTVAARRGIRGSFMLVAVTSERLGKIAALMSRRRLVARVGEIIPLSDARLAHEMLGGLQRKPGKILLVPPSDTDGPEHVLHSAFSGGKL